MLCIDVLHPRRYAWEDMEPMFDDFVVDGVKERYSKEQAAVVTTAALNRLVGVYCCNALTLTSALLDSEGETVDSDDGGSSSGDGDGGGGGSDDDDDDDVSDVSHDGEISDEGSSTTGILPMVACMNHSCSPNCVYEYIEAEAVVRVTATKDVDIGDELCISYLKLAEHEQSVSERRALLQDRFNFQCECDRCIAEDEKLVEGVAAPSVAVPAAGGGRIQQQDGKRKRKRKWKQNEATKTTATKK